MGFLSQNPIWGGFIMGYKQAFLMVGALWFTPLALAEEKV